MRGLKDLMHKPKTTMLLDHAQAPIELLKFGTTKYEDVKSFCIAIEEILFTLNTIRGKSASYTKDEIDIEVHDEYYGEIDAGAYCLNLLDFEKSSFLFFRIKQNYLLIFFCVKVINVFILLYIIKHFLKLINPFQ